MSFTRPVRRSLREHPFRYLFLGLMLWLTFLSWGWYALQQEQRRERAKAAANSDLKLCQGLNKINTRIRLVALNSDETRARFGVKHGPVPERVVRKAARRLDATGDYARRIVPFLDSFSNTDCTQLQSQRLVH